MKADTQRSIMSMPPAALRRQLGNIHPGKSEEELDVARSGGCCTLSSMILWPSCSKSRSRAVKTMAASTHYQATAEFRDGDVSGASDRLPASSPIAPLAGKKSAWLYTVLPMRARWCFPHSRAILVRSPLRSHSILPTFSHLPRTRHLPLIRTGHARYIRILIRILRRRGPKPNVEQNLAGRFRPRPYGCPSQSSIKRMNRDEEGKCPKHVPQRRHSGQYRQPIAVDVEFRTSFAECADGVLYEALSGYSLC